MKTFLWLICFSAIANAGSITGKVTSRAGSDPLINVNVQLQGTLRGTTTDENGRFEIANVRTGEHTLAFSLIGFQREVRSVTISDAESRVDLNVELVPVTIQASPVIVTASKREQSLQEVPVSVSTMDAASFAFRNSVTLDDALRYIPGVNLTDYQVNIRGASGYSRGAGSRVLMLVDGIPYLTGDTGEMNTESIPIGRIERVEVVKGASSALYGSNALGGVVNVITKPIPAGGETYIRTYGGFYNSPSFKSWDWKGGTRFLHGLSASYSRKEGSLGYVFFGSRAGDDGYKQNDARVRYNGYVKLRYDLTELSALTTTFNFMDQKRSSFLFWQDLNNALTPAASQFGDNIHSTRFFLSSSYQQVVSESFYFNVKAMWFKNRFRSVTSGMAEHSTADNLRGEFQGTWSIASGNIVTFGVEGVTDEVRADLFGNRSGHGFALYAQNELEIAQNLKATLGARYDFGSVDSLQSTDQINPKFGLVFTPYAGTAVRASYGRGFRTPSVAEAFIRTRSGGFPIIPNPNLKPERSSSYEVGVNQILGTSAIFDFALFHSDFSNLIEPGFTSTGSGQFNNVTKARVRGFETSAQIGLLGRNLILDCSYTYVFPKDLTKEDLLRYRPRHLAYVNLFGEIESYSTGIDFRYVSRVERVDDELVSLGIIKDGDIRVETYVVDIRFGIDLAKWSLPVRATLNINNLFQYNYVELIGNLAPPRTFVLALESNL